MAGEGLNPLKQLKEALREGIDAIIRREPLTLDECVVIREEMVQAYALLIGKVLVGESELHEAIMALIANNIPPYKDWQKYPSLFDQWFNHLTGEKE